MTAGREPDPRCVVSCSPSCPWATCPVPLTTAPDNVVVELAAEAQS